MIDVQSPAIHTFLIQNKKLILIIVIFPHYIVSTKKIRIDKTITKTQVERIYKYM